MDLSPQRQFVAFDGPRQIGAGSLREIARAAKRSQERGDAGPLLLFHTDTSQPLELDLRGSMEDVLARLPEPDERDAASLGARTDEFNAGAMRAVSTRALAAPVKSGPGRPRLGVVAREITLLPRHWQWLSEQPGGASVTIRRLVDAARSASSERDARRRAQESAYRFISAMLGDHAGFEEATRALFAGDAARFEACALNWPTDLRAHAQQLAAAVFQTHAVET